jgi:hypothetical protein
MEQGCRADKKKSRPKAASGLARRTAQEYCLMNSVIFGHTSSRQRRPEKMP